MSAGLVIDRGCCECQGKWNAIQAQHTWYGNEPFDSEVMCSVTPCPDNPLYNGTKYLTRRVQGLEVVSTAGSFWQYTSGDWVLVDCGINSSDYGATIDNTSTTNPITGCVEGSGHDIEETGTGVCGVSCNCTDTTVNGTNMCPYTCGLGPTHVKPLSIWASLDARCGQFLPIRDPCGSYYFTGGTADDLVATFPVDWTVVVDASSSSHLGFDARRDFTFTNPVNGPGSPPTDPGVEGQAICAFVEMHFRIKVTVDLSNPWTYEQFKALTYNLLDELSLKTEPMKDMPSCFGGGWFAGAGDTTIKLLTYDNVGAICASGMTNAGTLSCFPVPDGHVIHSYVMGTVETPFPLTWGAFERFDATPPCGVLTVQKWVLRQGSYKPYGYQDDPPAGKTWRYLLQEWTADFCTLDTDYSCANETGGEGFIICISPNGDFPNTAQSHTFWGGLSNAERNLGSDWQSVAKDVTDDTWPDCYPSAGADPPVYVEPASRACVCPTDVACAAPAPGACPFEPDDNWP